MKMSFLQTPVKEAVPEDDLTNSFSTIRINENTAEDRITNLGNNVVSTDDDLTISLTATEEDVWGLKRMAGHQTIEGTPLSDSFAKKR